MIFLKRFLIIFAVSIILLNVEDCFAQSIQLVDADTGKPVEKQKLPRFFSTGTGCGIIIGTSIKFSSSIFFTNSDESKITRSLFYGKSESGIKKYFRELILKTTEVVEKEITQKNAVRIVTLQKNDNGNEYSIFVYKSGKYFVSITTTNLELALEFETFLEK